MLYYSPYACSNVLLEQAWRHSHAQCFVEGPCGYRGHAVVEGGRQNDKEQRGADCVRPSSEIP